MKSGQRSSRERSAIIAIDGPAGAGKTSTARQVAKRLVFFYLDTGAMYRAVALKALRQNCDLNQPQDIARIVENTDITIRFGKGEQRIFLDGEDVTDLIRSPEVNRAVTPVCEVPEVRSRMVALQRKLGKDGGVVVEGRDIGTVVFPDADLKIFMTAELEERTRRRRTDFERVGINADLKDIAEEIRTRDRCDQIRNNSPLKQAQDAVTIDTTALSFEEQVEAVLRHFYDKCG